MNKQYTETVIANELETEAHMAQVRDLEERKARTSDFVVSKSGDLSIADQAHLSHSKWKNDDRQKEREALGYYRDWRSSGAENDANDKEWKTAGKVHTTQGEVTTTKEWEAPKEEKMETAIPPTFITEKATRPTAPQNEPPVASKSTTKNESPPANTDPVAQGCGCECVIL